MFSSSKILFANHVNREMPPPYITTTTPSPVPLSITVQPQNVTVSAGSTSTMGQTTWSTGAGYKRTMARWERSVDGINWYQENGYNSFSQSGGFSLPGGANPAQSGLKYRTYAYAYEECTRLPNYMDQSGHSWSNTYETLDNLGNQGGRLKLTSEDYYENFAFIFLKGGQFRIKSILFVGSQAATGRSNNSTYVAVRIGNASFASIRNIPALTTPAENIAYNIDFTASPGELMSFEMGPDASSLFPGIQYRFNIESMSDFPYGSVKVVSEPFTLTVIP